MKITGKMRERAKKLKKEMTAVYYAYRNPKTKPLPKLIILFALGYALSPIDLIPDFIPVLGYLDDLIIIPVLIALSIKLIPKKIMDESRERAAREPVTLKQKWLFAVFIILIWVFFSAGIVSIII